MKKTTQTLQPSWLQNNGIRVSRIHFGLCLLYALFIITSDAWNLVAREVTSERWLMFGLLLTVTTVVWFLCRGNVKSASYYRVLITILILADIALATFAIYTERGMASRGVALYLIPIITASALLNRSAIFGTALLSVATYTMAATRYFYVYFNEGYKAELYTTITLYSGVFLIAAALLWVVLTPTQKC